MRSGPSVPPGLSLQGRHFINVEMVRRVLERGTRIELVSEAWKATAQPLYQPRKIVLYFILVCLSTVLAHDRQKPDVLARKNVPNL